MRMLIVILTAYVFLVVITVKVEKNYGKFDLTLQEFEPCKGPKRKNCTYISTTKLNNTAVNYTINVIIPTKITKGKITAHINESDFLRLQMKDPCSHLFIGEILRITLNISKDCVIEPGYYNHIIDIANIADKYYGGMFLYGTYLFKAQFLANDCNFSCTTVVAYFAPKKT